MNLWTLVFAAGVAGVSASELGCVSECTDFIAPSPNFDEHNSDTESLFSRLDEQFSFSLHDEDAVGNRRDVCVPINDVSKTRPLDSSSLSFVSPSIGPSSRFVSTLGQGPVRLAYGSILNTAPPPDFSYLEYSSHAQQVASVSDHTPVLTDQAAFARSSWCCDDQLSVNFGNLDAPVATATFNLPNPDDMLTALTSRWDFNLAFDLSDLELHASTDFAFGLLGVPHIHDVPMFDATAMHIFTDGSFYAQNDS